MEVDTASVLAARRQQVKMVLVGANARRRLIDGVREHRRELLTLAREKNALARATLCAELRAAAQATSTRDWAWASRGPAGRSDMTDDDYDDEDSIDRGQRAHDSSMATSNHWDTSSHLLDMAGVDDEAAAAAMARAELEARDAQDAQDWGEEVDIDVWVAQCLRDLEVELVAPEVALLAEAERRQADDEAETAYLASLVGDTYLGPAPLLSQGQRASRSPTAATVDASIDWLTNVPTPTARAGDSVRWATRDSSRSAMVDDDDNDDDNDDDDDDDDDCDLRAEARHSEGGGVDSDDAVAAADKRLVMPVQSTRTSSDPPPRLSPLAGHCPACLLDARLLRRGPVVLCSGCGFRLDMAGDAAPDSLGYQMQAAHAAHAAARTPTCTGVPVGTALGSLGSQRLVVRCATCGWAAAPMES